MTAFIEPIQDATGAYIFKVHTFCGNAAHAQATVRAINSVPPASAFVPVPQPETPPTWAEVAAMPEREYTTEDVLATLQLSDDDWGAEGEPPRCKSGACDL